MTYTKEQVMNGIINYIDSDIMTKLPTSGKWIVGTAVGLASTRANELFDNPVLSMLGIVDENGNVDIDNLLTSMKASADKYGKLTFEVPIIGRMTFSSTDVDNLRGYIV